MAAAQPVSAQVVGNAFVQQYYHILHHSPGLVHRFYQDISKLGRPEDDGSMSITTTMQAINEKILSLDYVHIRAEIQCVDAQESLNGGVHVLVTGYLTEKDSMIRNFTQTFFLAPQDRGYFVLNDMFRYVDNGTKHAANSAPANDVVAPVTLEQNHPPMVGNHISELIIPSAEEANGGEVYNSPENREVPVVEEEVPVVEEEVPVAEVVDEVHDGSRMVVESDTKIEEVPKKSYASIVMDLKDSAATFSPPPPAPRKPIPKTQEQVNQSSASVTDGLVSSSDADENGNHEGEAADGYSIYIKGLPVNATPSMLHEEFKKFGPIKNGGIQVRKNRQQGFCFGFVEFEVASAVEKALEASPIAIGESQAVVEEKRSTNSRVNINRGRFLPGRGSGFRNEGMRGRGNYGGARGYNRNDFGGRNEFSNRGGNHGGSSNRSDGFQRVEKVTDNGRRMNRPAGVANGNAKNIAPRVSATA